MNQALALFIQSETYGERLVAKEETLAGTERSGFCLVQ